MASITVKYPAAPPVAPLTGTLLQTATVQDNVTWLDGLDLWQSYANMQFGQAAVFCDVNTIDTDSTDAEWVSGFRFAAYGAVTCKAVGLDLPAQEAAVREAFLRGESTAVERALMDVRFEAAAGDNAGRWATPTDITPVAGAVKPSAGVGLLEGYMASVYTGTPTIHMPRVIASLLIGLDGAVLDGSTLFTKLGSRIVAGAGYDFPNHSPGGADNAAGERWIYASGPVYVGRSSVEIRQVFDQSINDVIVLAERAYIVAVDGPVAALRVLVDR